MEDNILKILRQRMLDCYLFHFYPDDKAKYCTKLEQEYKTAETNWFIKCKKFYYFVCYCLASLVTQFVNVSLRNFLYWIGMKINLLHC